MNIEVHKSFTKQAQKLPVTQKDRLKIALRKFQGDPYHADLYNHALTGKWKGHRSISFGGNWRALYIQIDPKTALFVAVGTHSQLYG